MKTQAQQTLLFLANYNSWRRGDETLEMPSPAEIGAMIDDAVNLLRKYDDLKARAERAEDELSACKNSLHLADGTANLALVHRDAAEAELKEWSILKLWGGTPEIIHSFIKGQQNRIYAAEKAEAELHALRLICGTTDADKFSTWVDRANARAEKAESELATERARLRIVEEFMLRRHIPQAEDDYPQIWLGNGYFDTLADAADAAMKEETK